MILNIKIDRIRFQMWIYILYSSEQKWNLFKHYPKLKMIFFEGMFSTYLNFLLLKSFRLIVVHNLFSINNLGTKLIIPFSRNYMLLVPA